jgi:hypothetical protein
MARRRTTADRWDAAREFMVEWCKTETVTLCGEIVRVLYQKVPVRHSVKVDKENAGRETK